MKRIVFDIETFPFSEEFRTATTTQARRRHAPEMRLVCVYDEKRNEYKFFTPLNAKRFIRLLQSADEVISFNGKAFDCLVCRKHYGLKGRVPLKGRHIDIHEIMTAKAGFRVSLDSAAQHNLGERKHTDGRKMSELNDEQLKEACRSDVCHTYRLWRRYVEGTLRCPPSRRWSKDEGSGDRGNFPRECSFCLSVGFLEPVEWETEDMSEGQLSDYLAGICGTARCSMCGKFIDYGF